MGLPNMHIKEYLSKHHFKNCMNVVKIFDLCTIKRRSVTGNSFQLTFWQ